jgi:hypothetical protein
MAVKISFGKVPFEEEEDSLIVQKYQAWLTEQAKAAEIGLAAWQKDKDKELTSMEAYNARFKKYGPFASPAYCRAILEARKQWSLTLIEVMG